MVHACACVALDLHHGAVTRNKTVPPSFIETREGVKNKPRGRGGVGRMISLQARRKRETSDLSSERPWAAERKRWPQWRGINKDEIENPPLALCSLRVRHVDLLLCWTHL